MSQKGRTQSNRMKTQHQPYVTLADRFEQEEQKKKQEKRMEQTAKKVLDVKSYFRDKGWRNLFPTADSRTLQGIQEQLSTVSSYPEGDMSLAEYVVFKKNEGVALKKNGENYGVWLAFDTDGGGNPLYDIETERHNYGELREIPWAGASFALYIGMEHSNKLTEEWQKSSIELEKKEGSLSNHVAYFSFYKTLNKGYVISGTLTDGRKTSVHQVAKDDVKSFLKAIKTITFPGSKSISFGAETLTRWNLHDAPNRIREQIAAKYLNEEASFMMDRPVEAKVERSRGMKL